MHRNGGVVVEVVGKQPVGMLLGWTPLNTLLIPRQSRTGSEKAGAGLSSKGSTLCTTKACSSTVVLLP